MNKDMRSIEIINNEASSSTLVEESSLSRLQKA
jgi:hypothetical protein